MKTLFISLFTLAALFAFPQSGFQSEKAPRINYDVQGLYKRPVKQQALADAKLLSDAIEGYPVNWISAYAVVDVSGINGGKKKKAFGIGVALNKEQRDILSKVDMASDVVINVKYKYNNPGTGKVENNSIHVVMTVVPDSEAEFVGGKQLMREYLKENVISKIPESKVKQLRPAILKFTVNEAGEITNAKFNNSSGDSGTDQLMLEAISKMPKWKPAQMSDGKKVKQEFKFSLGNNIGC